MIIVLVGTITTVNDNFKSLIIESLSTKIVEFFVKLSLGLNGEVLVNITIKFHYFLSGYMLGNDLRLYKSMLIW